MVSTDEKQEVDEEYQNDLNMFYSCSLYALDKNQDTFLSNKYDNITLVSVLGYREIDCSKMSFINRWMCNYFEDYPQNKITDLYNGLNDNPQRFDIPEDNIINERFEKILFPIVVQKPLKRINDYNVCYNAD